MTPAVWSAAGEGFVSVYDRCADAYPSSCKVIEYAHGGHIYVVTPEDVGFMIRAWSNLTWLGWSLGSQSEATAVVTPAPTTPPPTPPPASTPPPTSKPQATKPTNTVRPKITGKAKPDHKLTVRTGTWKGTARITYKYRWKSCDKKLRRCQAIQGATKTFLRISAKYRGRRLVVVVTASNVAGRTAVTSKATGVVAS